MKIQVLVQPDGSHVHYYVQIKHWRTCFMWKTIQLYCCRKQDDLEQEQEAVDFAKNYKGSRVIKI